MLVLEEEFSETLTALDQDPRAPSFRLKPQQNHNRQKPKRSTSSFASLDYATFRVTSACSTSMPSSRAEHSLDAVILDFDDYIAQQQQEIGQLGQYMSNARDRRDTYAAKKWQSEVAVKKAAVAVDLAVPGHSQNSSILLQYGGNGGGTQKGALSSTMRRLKKSSKLQRNGSRGSRMNCRTFSAAMKAAATAQPRSAAGMTARNASSTLRKSSSACC
jgi:hypothetical protein